jgi:2-(1,2-epoxy-1,2-dihydrophenyl)acetyl-CoA isomerase
MTDATQSQDEMHRAGQQTAGVWHVRVDVDAGVGLITIDRRDRYNSLDVATAQELRRAGLQMARDDAVRVVVLRGSGGVFCSGADLKYVRGADGTDDLSYLQPAARKVESTYGERFKQILEYLHSAISEITRAPKPFIAAVDGMAAAGGFGLAMACDLIFASERACFEWAYSKTGLTGAESATFFLPRLIGLRRAMQLALLNPRLEPAEAWKMGLINGIFPTERFDAELMAIARRLADGPTRTYAIAKSLLNSAAGIDRLDYHLDQEREQLTWIADEPEFESGVEAFFAARRSRNQEE